MIASRLQVCWSIREVTTEPSEQRRIWRVTISDLQKVIVAQETIALLNVKEEELELDASPDSL